VAYISENYRPSKKSREILERAWLHIQSVPYHVTSRWLFYRLLQDGFYKKKGEYKNAYIPLISRARHNYFEGWRPDTLVDDSRDSIKRTGGFTSVADWVEDYSSGGFTCSLDHFYRQPNYIELWFEAEAMVRQFTYYTDNINLRPFSGMPSIAYKYSIAEDLGIKAKTYKKDIVILYFGDYDPAGMMIQDISVEDIRTWCRADFEVVRCGLNEGDAERYSIPENFEKPGEYQWEALTDQAAGEIINTAVNKYIDTSIIDQVNREGWHAAKAFNDYVAGFADYYEEYSQG